MSLTFDAAAHVYTLDGVVVPSVTGILKASGLIDFSQIPPAVLEVARARGERTHRAIHYYNEGDLDWSTLDDGDRPRVNAWLRFIEQRKFQILKAEFRVYSRRYGYAGTGDVLGLLDGKLALADFKLGKPEDVAADLQTSAYVGALYEMKGDSDPSCDWVRDVMAHKGPLQRFSIQLPANGTPKVDLYQNPMDFREFVALVEARRIVEQRRGYFAAWLRANNAA